MKENQDLVGQWFYNDKLTPSMRVCKIMWVVENNPKDIYYETVNGDYGHVEFASFARRNLITYEDTLEIAVCDGRAEIAVQKLSAIVRLGIDPDRYHHLRSECAELYPKLFEKKESP
jgi:hypothetical protein